MASGTGGIANLTLAFRGFASGATFIRDLNG